MHQLQFKECLKSYNKRKIRTNQVAVVELIFISDHKLTLFINYFILLLHITYKTIS